MQAATGKRRSPASEDEVMEALVSRKIVISTTPSERQAEVEAKQIALEGDMKAGVEAASFRRSSQLVSKEKLDVCQRALRGEPEAKVEPPGVMFKPDRAMDRVRARPCCRRELFGSVSVAF